MYSEPHIVGPGDIIGHLHNVLNADRIIIDLAPSRYYPEWVKFNYTLTPTVAEHCKQLITGGTGTYA